MCAAPHANRNNSAHELCTLTMATMRCGWINTPVRICLSPLCRCHRRHHHHHDNIDDDADDLHHNFLLKLQTSTALYLRAMSLLASARMRRVYVYVILCKLWFCMCTLMFISLKLQQQTQRNTCYIHSCTLGHASSTSSSFVLVIRRHHRLLFLLLLLLLNRPSSVSWPDASLGRMDGRTDGRSVRLTHTTARMPLPLLSVASPAAAAGNLSAIDLVCLWAL